MKKIIVTLAVLCLSLCCVFATVHKVKASFTPFGFQSITTSEKDVAALRSKWSIGGGAGYEYAINDHVFFGINFNVVTNFFQGKKNLTDISFVPRLGYNYFLNKNMDIYGAFEYGIVNQYFNKTHGTVQVFGPVLGARYLFDGTQSIYGEMEDQFSFSKKDGIKYANYRLNFNFGYEYKF